MRCGICNYPEVMPSTTTVEEWDGDELVVIRAVPVEKCPQCGEEYFAPDVLRALEKMTAHRHDNGQPVSVLHVPVFDFAPA